MTNLAGGVAGEQWGWVVTATDALFDNSGVAITGSRINATLLRSTVRNSKGYGAACGRCLLTVVESDITANALGGLSVGNIGSMTVTDSTVSENGGPGVTAHDGDAVVERSAITGNSTDAMGGGFLLGPGGGATVRDSTIADNTAALDGGGASVQGYLYISDSTMKGNVAGRYGGGIYATGTLSLADSTVTENVATSGGGLYVDDPTSVSLLGSNTIADNVPDDCVGIPSC